MVTHILSIHIPLTEKQDSIVWPLTKSGQYDVKSGYFASQSQQDQGQTDYAGWKNLWKLKLPPKFSLFIWKCLQRILAVKVSLVRRNIQVDSTCPRCQGAEETIEHLFFECPIARRIW